jgi:hypothetical protein
MRVQLRRSCGTNVAKTIERDSQMGGAVLNGFYRNGVVVAAALTFIASASVARAQGSARSDAQRDEARASQIDEAPTVRNGERQTTGTVTSAGRASLVVRTDAGDYEVFAIDRALVGIPPVDPGARVRITTAADDTGPGATVVSIDRLPPRQGLSPQPPDRVPQDVQRITSQIERQARRFRAGVIAGVALDPEMISLDAFATLTPWPRPRLAIRPGMEFAFGEITTLLAWNIDVLYSVPGVRPLARWAPYVGAGPNFSFSHRGIDEDEFLSDGSTVMVVDDNDRFDFSQWDWNNGLNFIVGARNPSGTFFELKATAWGTANVRALAGFEF